MVLKSERLKKLENEYKDLEHWLNLGLVPKKDLEKHKEEMKGLHEKIEDEKKRLQHLKESGDLEDYVPPKRQAGRAAYAEPHTLPEMEAAPETATEAGIEMETETFTTETEGGVGEDVEEGTAPEEEDLEDPFSDKNRWKRGILEDPESNEW